MHQLVGCILITYTICFIIELLMIYTTVIAIGMLRFRHRCTTGTKRPDHSGLIVSYSFELIRIRWNYIHWRRGRGFILRTTTSSIHNYRVVVVSECI